MARIHAELGAIYAAVGDVTGMNYSVRKLTAYTQAALATLADLNASAARGINDASH
jgi:hypothetical protein